MTARITGVLTAVLLLAACSGAVPTSLTITTAKGSFTVPGAAFADGRDAEAKPPVTIMRINVWDAVPRRRVLCRVDHAEPLELLRAIRDSSEDRYYFQIRTNSCKGWLPESFVAPRAEPPVGTRQ